MKKETMKTYVIICSVFFALALPTQAKTISACESLPTKILDAANFAHGMRGSISQMMSNQSGILTGWYYQLSSHEGTTHYTPSGTYASLYQSIQALNENSQAVDGDFESLNDQIFDLLGSYYACLGEKK